MTKKKALNEKEVDDLCDQIKQDVLGPLTDPFKPVIPI